MTQPPPQPPNGGSEPSRPVAPPPAARPLPPQAWASPPQRRPPASSTPHPPGQAPVEPSWLTKPPMRPTVPPPGTESRQRTADFRTPLRPPPRKRPHTGAIIAVVLTGVFLLSVGVIGMVAVASGSGGNASGTAVAELPSTEATAEPTAEPTAGSATATPSEKPPSEPSTTTEVDGTRRSVTALGDHPFNTPNAGAVPTPCSLPSFDTDVESQDAFYRAALPCLMAIWTPALQVANLPVQIPNVVTTGGDANSPCGTRPWNETAMYCAGNHTIYMTARHYAEVERQTEAGAYLGQFAHEFGHAIQGMIGINNAYANAVYDVGGYGTATGLELSRRSELQATCFEGMALAALQNGGVSNDYIFPALKDSANRGDEYNRVPDHGSIATNRSWVEQGFFKNRVSECNTWLAQPSQVD